VAYHYDEERRLVGWTKTDGAAELAAELQYDGDGRPARLTRRNAGSPWEVYEYRYDDQGRLESMVWDELDEGLSWVYQSFRYETGRLVGMLQGAYYEWSWSLLAHGRLLELRLVGGEEAEAYWFAHHWYVLFDETGRPSAVEGYQTGMDDVGCHRPAHRRRIDVHYRTHGNGALASVRAEDDWGRVEELAFDEAGNVSGDGYDYSCWEEAGP